MRTTHSLIFVITICAFGVLSGCGSKTENAVLPAPEKTLQDYERIAAEEQAEQEAISKQP